MKKIHTDNVRPDGTIDDTVVETHYTPLVEIQRGDGYLRVFADNGATNIETRIPFEAIRQLILNDNGTN